MKTRHNRRNRKRVTRRYKQKGGKSIPFTSIDEELEAMRVWRESLLKTGKTHELRLHFLNIVNRMRELPKNPTIRSEFKRMTREILELKASPSLQDMVERVLKHLDSFD
jgi:hypothetical protein